LSTTHETTRDAYTAAAVLHTTAGAIYRRYITASLMADHEVSCARRVKFYIDTPATARSVLRAPAHGEYVKYRNVTNAQLSAMRDNATVLHTAVCANNQLSAMASSLRVTGAGIDSTIQQIRDLMTRYDAMMQRYQSTADISPLHTLNETLRDVETILLTMKGE